jgi:hypothetical protein
MMKKQVPYVLSDAEERRKEFEKIWTDKTSQLVSGKSLPDKETKIILEQIPAFFEQLSNDALLDLGFPFPSFYEDTLPNVIISVADAKIQRKYDAMGLFVNSINEIYRSSISESAKIITLAAYYVFLCELVRDSMPPELVKGLYEKTRNEKEKQDIQENGKASRYSKEHIALGDFEQILERYDNGRFAVLNFYSDAALRNAIAHGHIYTGTGRLYYMTGSKTEEISLDDLEKLLLGAGQVLQFVTLQYELSCYRHLVLRINVEATENVKMADSVEAVLIKQDETTEITHGSSAQSAEEQAESTVTAEFAIDKESSARIVGSLQKLAQAPQISLKKQLDEEEPK